jgi:hypothetical protein
MDYKDHPRITQHSHTGAENGCRFYLHSFYMSSWQGVEIYILTASSKGTNKTLFCFSYRNGSLNVDWLSNEGFCWTAYNFFRVSVVTIKSVRNFKIKVNFVNTMEASFYMWKHKTLLSHSLHGTMSTGLEVDLLLWLSEFYKSL